MYLYITGIPTIEDVNQTLFLLICLILMSIHYLVADLDKDNSFKSLTMIFYLLSLCSSVGLDNLIILANSSKLILLGYS